MRVEPTGGLHVELYEDSLECIQPSEGELRRGAILRDSFGNRAARKCAKRKLNNLGAIVGQATVVNSMENMEKMRDNLQFASAMAQISHEDTAEKKRKEKEADKLYDDHAPDAAKKFEKYGRDNMSKLTVKDIEAILYKVYSIKISGSKLKKQDYIRALEQEFNKNFMRYAEFASSLGLRSSDKNDAAAAANTEWFLCIIGGYIIHYMSTLRSKSYQSFCSLCVLSIELFSRPRYSS